MVTFKDVLNNPAALATALGTTPTIVNVMLEIMTKKKAAKADTLFKKTTSGKLSSPGKKPFLYMKGANGGFFFINFDFSLVKKDLQAKVDSVKKQVGKAKEDKKEGLKLQREFYQELLKLVKTKKITSAYGKMSIAKVEGSDCFMSLQGMTRGDYTSNAALAAELAAFSKPLATKAGEVLKFSEVETAPSGEEKVTSGGAPTSSTTAEDIAKFKAIQKKYVDFANNEHKAITAKKPQTLVDAFNKAETISKNYKAWLALANGKQELAAQIQKAKGKIASLTNLINQLAPKIEEYNAALTEKANKELKRITKEIEAMIADLLDNHGDDVANVDGLKDGLSQFSVA